VNDAAPKNIRQKRRAITGVLLLDKPAGISSTNALGRAKWLFQVEKGGHTGTLDPFATGLLPLCFGEATKFSRFMLDADKTYVATLKLGSRTPTGDTESEPFENRAIEVDLPKIHQTLSKFVGPQNQIPPMHSALKRDGVALYKLARQGIEVEREPRAITIFAINFVSFDGIFLVIETKVSKGTYIRVLAEDIGEALGCGAHLTGLRRTATAGYSVDSAATLEAIEILNLEQREQILKPADSLCLALPKIILDKNEELIFCNGGWLSAPREPHARMAAANENAPNANEYAIYSEGGRFLGIAEVTLAHAEPRLIPMRLMATGKVD
jgi:tRNA pseudouridine55 synthase